VANQTGKNIIVGYKVEGTFNTAPGTGSAEQLRVTASPGMSLVKALINSAEVRSDGQSSLARHGSRSAPGSYNVEMSVDTFDTPLQALLRSTWVAAVGITFNNGAALTSLTVNSSSQVTFAGTTTPVAAGLRVGDVFRLASMSTAANDAVNCRVASISGSVVNLLGTPLTTQSADTACTLTILRKLSAAATPTKRTFYVDEYHVDTDVSEVFGGCRFVGFSLRGTPDGMAEGTLTLLGASGAVLATGSSPYFVAPTLTTTIPLVFADAKIAFNGADVTTCTAWEMNYEIAAATQPVVGASVSPDVFDNDARLTGALSFVREDLAKVSLYLAETPFSIHLMLTEPESEPKDCIAIFIGYATITGASADMGSDGAMIETIPWASGVRPTTTGFDASLMTISTSAT